MLIEALNRASQIYSQITGKRWQDPAVIFSAATNEHGMSKAMYGLAVTSKNLLFINPDQTADQMQDTIRHELAHFLQDRIFGEHATLEHGSEWITLAEAMGCDPFWLSGQKRKPVKRYILQLPDGKIVASKRKKSGLKILLEC